LPPKVERALKLQPLPADAYAYYAWPDAKWVNRRSAFTANPEWLALRRRHKLNLIARTLTDILPVQGVDEERYFPLDTEEEQFDF
jgi:hypothetical protein